MTSSDDLQHRERMAALVEFTSTSLATEFPSPFGSSIYDLTSGRLVAQAYDTVIQYSDPTNHAEMNAIRLATTKLGRLSLQGHILYSTCEPCPMCMSACIWAEVNTVVFGASTLEDANHYWPQASDLSPTELVAHMCREPKCLILPHIERASCQELFRQCDETLQQRGLRLPPHR
ncbi:nucleoside deaminase [Bythopirellula polymerisocia]|uniref:Guanine deaminase n=1 Tax=Bythopirellula polymerisocia TaxID=2528003 RepID=A0A5C6D4R4_9BACT|nr:nucleoside deaminase [Bythopirellula polymerisocia]TWU29859.1 Guanine deaminase [Bythopirellula polymerisocia]